VADAQSRPDENPDDEWRACLDVEDELPVFCPECAEREFGGSHSPRVAP
jgi:hypothetical protein